MANKDWKPKLKRPESAYDRELGKLADRVGEIAASAGSASIAIARLEQYAQRIEKWAQKVAGNMIADLESMDMAMWLKHTSKMTKAMQQEIRRIPIQGPIQVIQGEQVSLIKSLPLEAAQRIRDIASGEYATGQRPENMIRSIMETGDVTRSRATTIARTEVSRIATEITMFRATSIGSETYTWMTAGDGDVRFGHNAMRGKAVRWDTPPPVNNGTRKKPKIIHHHAGCIWRCRCYTIPRFIDKYERR